MAAPALRAQGPGFRRPRARQLRAPGRDEDHRRDAWSVWKPGRVVIELPWAQALTQQHGFLHAGMVATALDSACGYAGSSLMPADAAC